MERLIYYLESIYPLSDGLKKYLLDHLKVRQLSKKQYLLRAGHVSRYIYFIETGLLKCFYMSNNIEVCSWFMKEGDVIISVESFFTQKPSYEAIQAIEDCELYFIEYNELQFIYRNFPEFNFVGRVLTEKYYTLSEQRLYSMRMQRASERYQYLLDHFPELIKRVASKYLASYLGVTEVTLSKIKCKIYT